MDGKMHRMERRLKIFIGLCIALTFLVLILSLNSNNTVKEYNLLVEDLNDCRQELHGLKIVDGPSYKPIFDIDLENITGDIYG